MKYYSDINEVYHDALTEILEGGLPVTSINDIRSIGSGFGQRQRDFIELKGYSFVLTNPLNRIVSSNIRNISIGFASANLIWVLSGNSSANHITFYNSKGKVFANNDLYYEAAFGSRLFGKYQLLEQAFLILKRDPSTRRAFIPLYFHTDLISNPLDSPCAASLHFLIRDSRLDCFLNMRSQSVAMVFPYDIFLFTILQELLSQKLNIKIGNLYYYCSSFHVYKEEIEMVERIVKAKADNQLHSAIMSPMPDFTNELLEQISKIETIFRNNNGKIIDDFYLLPKYWQDILTVSFIKGSIENNFNINLNTNHISTFNYLHI